MTIEKRLERVEAILDARGLDWDHPRVDDDHFADANKMVADEPAKEPKPAWEPKVGDWVRVTRPGDWIEWEYPKWEGSMHQFEGQVGQIECEWEGHFQIRGFAASNEFRYQFHRDWLSPAEPPKDEYREPVLPADAGKYCQFSDDGIEWRTGWLNGWGQRSHQWVSHSGGHWRHCRIKKDA